MSILAAVGAFTGISRNLGIRIAASCVPCFQVLLVAVKPHHVRKDSFITTARDAGLITGRPCPTGLAIALLRFRNIHDAH